MKINNEIIYKPIGIIHTAFTEAKGTPIQASVAKDTAGEIEIFEEYIEGLTDLEEYSHIILLYHFHLTAKTGLLVKPFMDNQTHGVFSTRAPSRPNPIGISTVRLIDILGNKLQIKDVDIIDGTYLLDIKPFIPEFDLRDVKKTGWVKNNMYKLADSKDDGRFLI